MLPLLAVLLCSWCYICWWDYLCCGVTSAGGVTSVGGVTSAGCCICCWLLCRRCSLPVLVVLSCRRYHNYPCAGGVTSASGVISIGGVSPLLHLPNQKCNLLRPLQEKNGYKVLNSKNKCLCMTLFCHYGLHHYKSDL
ncbi:hypothetical protein PoB_007136900 [Plakobranchus ocellatus]|uniref:Secreted protein n=1 Tax=Plakobranchus ocellatus TaxID=259542 RepID=A0AAV4DLD2_9GAST|nr:hypothetical protein PoB_007136900 [Plakobranchus ocellatus]